MDFRKYVCTLVKIVNECISFRLLGHLMNETGLDLPKNFTDELMKILNYIEMNGLDESMFNKNSSLISR